jgi:hypothetical protein
MFDETFVMSTRQGWKKPGFEKNSPVFFCIFLYNCSEERVFRVFQFQEYFLGASRL